MPKISTCWQIVAASTRAGLFATICIFQLAAQEKTAAVSQPLSPTEALAKFQLAEEDLQIELAAAEPEVIDPVAIRFDERGRMWVAEMRDYPLGPPASGTPGKEPGPPLSRIKVLEDRDADGRFETATVFAEKLSFVTGLQPWKGGVIVTLAGRIAWMKDSDNDGKMDVDETWYTGFAEQNSQLRANHPRLALDNHVYVANGLRGGVVVNKRLPDEKPISLQGRDFRFDPLTGKAESISGNGQFGMCFDDWGNRFTCTNRNPVIHVVLEDRYLKLAPKIPIPAVVQDVAAAAEKSKVFPISRAWTTSNLHAGTFTAACGVHIYRGDTLRAVLGTNSAFTCDPTGNFVHREVMQPDGPSFTSKPAYDGKEFLASTDEWFRPVNVELGPDGCLYIVDMYRCVIEHPDFVPDELKKRPDLRLGDDRGRIWRITPKANFKRKPIQDIAGSKPSELVSLLASDNAWQRETIQRLLLQLLDQPAASEASYRNALRDVVRNGESPLARSHALSLLRSLKSADTLLLLQALKHDDARVRRQALLCAEDLIDAGDRVARSLISKGDSDTDAAVRWQALLLGIPRQKLAENQTSITSRIPFDDLTSRWTQVALLLRYHQQLSGLYEKTPNASWDAVRFRAQVAQLIGSQGSDNDAQLVIAYLHQSEPTNPAFQAIVFDSLARGLQSQKRNLTDTVGALAGDNRVAELRELVTDQETLARDPKATLEVRLAAIRTLGHLVGTGPLLARLAHDATLVEAELKTTAVAAIAQRGDESQAEWKALLAEYDTQPLVIRRAVVENSFRRKDGPALLLEQVKAGVIQPAEIDPLRRKNLLESKDAAIKKLAEELFAALNPANRQQALEEYQAVLKLTADAKQGAVIFEKNCSTCHRVGEIGVNVAPDISDTRTKTAAQLLGDIIQPNRAIDSNFIGYQLLLKDGTATSGILTAETSTSLTLKQPGGKVLTIARDDVEQLKATGVSLMPDGLEKNIPPQAMADLLSYLKNWRYLDGKTPLSPGTP